jgi:DNA polymerase-3 subunit gamma/tau
MEGNAPVNAAVREVVPAVLTSKIQIPVVPVQAASKPTKAAAQQAPAEIKQQPVSQPVSAVEAPEPAQTSEIPSGTAAEINIQKIQENWSAIRIEVKKVLPQTEALLNSIKSLNLKNGILAIGFSSEILKSKMDTTENLNLTQDAIYKVMGVQIKVQCVVAGNKSGTVSADMGIEADSIVSTALNLGGKLIHRE